MEKKKSIWKSKEKINNLNGIVRVMDVKITNIYSNVGQPEKNLKGDHGNSFLIEFGSEKILFDLGWKGDILLHNLNELKINADEISKIIFSHGHMDHTKALPAFLKLRDPGKKITIIGHPRIMEKKKAKMFGLRLIKIGFPKLSKIMKSMINFQFSKEPIKINEFLTFTGEISERPDKDGTHKRMLHNNNGVWESDPLLDDASLVLETRDGLVIIGGCMHTGILNTCRFVHNLFNGKKIIAIIGGTHMVGFNEEEVEYVAKELEEKYGTPKLHLNHCTGEKAIKQLNGIFGSEIVLPCLVGTFFTYECQN
ncbi:MBL fold metallo-hydrolase [Promethearchaeum syntrophicum]|uniref:MBL fold metallo-hydrolase n=1 Tax=Promethearchaeum syntrophicum TaxID=2594042 RepID=A0A5B9DA33_9ARCH|nr:MBL fold metallo-hydrolase [Candidatus Prometheoarchaeum syntrophicum]QEE16089.1 7,8-dihydropterin-6-methyl-4-(beta-D-ribofuranosyl)-aminobenzene-5'-phosphate synthase [Candidatus Prometheoarchaeum syntrophicum]